MNKKQIMENFIKKIIKEELNLFDDEIFSLNKHIFDNPTKKTADWLVDFIKTNNYKLVDITRLINTKKLNTRDIKMAFINRKEKELAEKIDFLLSPFSI